MAADYTQLLQLQRTLDPGNMLDRVAAFPANMADACDRGSRFALGLAASQGEFDKIVVCGMGGSAIGGDMARSYLGDNLSLPLFVNRAYDVPAPLRSRTLFVFSSYSGNTGETLSQYESVRGSAHSIAITSGGQLAALCDEDGVPVCRIPGGMPPRAAIAYSLFPLLLALRGFGIASFDDSEFDDTRHALDDVCKRYMGTGSDNRAAEIATALAGKRPVIYSGTGLFEAVARRWSCQFNENGKSLAHYATFPELDHNEIVGWRDGDPLLAASTVVVLEDSDDDAMTRKQIDVARDIIRPIAGDVVTVNVAHGGRLERILSTMLLGDFASVYLAYLNGVDPTPVDNIDLLKKRLSE